MHLFLYRLADGGGQLSSVQHRHLMLAHCFHARLNALCHLTHVLYHLSTIIFHPHACSPSFLCFFGAPNDTLAERLLLHSLGVSLPPRADLSTRSLTSSLLLSSYEPSPTMMAMTIPSMPRAIFFARRVEGWQDGSSEVFTPLAKRSSSPFTDSASLFGRWFVIAYSINADARRHYS